jgi:hypothetical protein
VKTPIDPDFDELAREYLEALKSKRLAAPASEPLVARSALRRLGQVLRSKGKGTTCPVTCAKRGRSPS